LFVSTNRTPVAALTARARQLWEFLAGTDTGFTPAISVAVSPRSHLCPPDWLGIVVLGDAAIATAPDHLTARLAEQALSDLPAASLTDTDLLSNRLPVAEILGSAALAYRDWPCGTAHLCVLTASAARGRGLARAAASAAVAHAIEQGRLPQWRARPQASRRVASALGFRELGFQVSIRLTAAATSREP
jgi:GNAT superfamily N-acetyltransferase